ncbi:MAG: prepilin-type N-terminal cleavage/methylation domain-containing protein [Planctomycetes bacterium]|nr:prepilin-type N-terminal cleavage/methylation domain-containing protein [Planctomycetota bacterium]
MRAFTLVELLVALVLGMVVALAAFASFRIAAKSMSAAGNLSRENRVIAQGYFAAMSEADFWYAEDDPFAASGQAQRRSYDGAGGPVAVGTDRSHGQPFAEMDQSDEFWNFNLADQRTWSRQGEYKCTHFFSWSTGSYAQVGCIDHPDPSGACAWMHVVQDRLYSCLGWNGYLDYVPSPWTLGFYLGCRNDTDPPYNSFNLATTGTPGGAWAMTAFPDEFWMSGMNAYPHFQASYHAPEKALGRSGIHIYGISTLFSPRPGWTESGANAEYLRASVGTLVDRAPTYNDLVPRLPGLSASLPHASLTCPGWPELSVKVLRSSDLLVTGRTKATIAVSNPTTGSRHSISFLPIGSTLRGARQQRQWPHWGGASLDR